MTRTLIQKLFGKRFNLADIIFIVLILGYPLYLGITKGLNVLLEDFASQIWSGIVIGYFVFFFLRRVKR